MAIIEEMYFALPIYTANMTPVFLKKINFLNYPINKNLFGENKTIRGFLGAVIIAIIFAYLQLYLYQYDFMKKISLINYHEKNIFLFGFLAGFGAITGDLIKSYFKRKRNIKPGHSWIPFDQLDFMIGALLFISPIAKLKFKNIITLLIITPFLHILFNHIGYYLGINKNKW